MIGGDDYTGRMRFYVEHAIRGIPMFIDNIDAPMGFIRYDEAGRFLAFLVDHAFRGAVNGSSEGTISVREILDYVEQKTGCKAILATDGDEAPYNDDPAYCINTDRAEKLMKCAIIDTICKCSGMAGHCSKKAEWGKRENDE